MLLVICSWLYLLLISLGLGCAFLELTIGLNICKNEKCPNLPLVSGIGIVIAAVLCQIASLFTAINEIVFIGFGMGGLVGLWFGRNPLTEAVRNLYIFWKANYFIPLPVMAAIALTFLLSCLHSPTNYDTGLYHAQAIQWIEKYPVIIGHGLFFMRSGFNNSFFPLSALTGLSFWHGQSIYAVNGFLVTWLYAYLTGIVFSRQPNQIFAACLGLVSIWLFDINYSNHFMVSSPTPDIATIVMAVGVVLCLLQPEENIQEKLTTRDLFIVLASLFLPTIKLSMLNFPAVILVLFLLKPTVITLKNIRFTVIAAVFIVGVWVIRNYIISGYLAFPVESTGFFHPDWQVPSEVTISEMNWIKSWARIPEKDSEEVLKLSLAEWFPVWYTGTIPKANQNLFNVVLFGLFIVPASLFLRLFRRTVSGPRKALYLYWLVFAIGTACWFFSGPYFRYGYGNIIPTAVIGILVVIPFQIEKIRFLRPIFMVLFVVLSFFQVRSYFMDSSKLADFKYTDHLVLPERIKVETEFAEDRRNGFSFFRPTTGDRCYDHPIPCTISQVNFELRGRTVAEGFRLKKE